MQMVEVVHEARSITYEYPALPLSRERSREIAYALHRPLDPRIHTFHPAPPVKVPSRTRSLQASSHESEVFHLALHPPRMRFPRPRRFVTRLCALLNVVSPIPAPAPPADQDAPPHICLLEVLQRRHDPRPSFSVRSFAVVQEPGEDREVIEERYEKELGAERDEGRGERDGDAEVRAGYEGGDGQGRRGRGRGRGG